MNIDDINITGGLERFYLLACIGIVLFVVVAIVLVYFKNLLFKKLNDLSREEKRLNKEGRNNCCNEYVACRNTFNSYMKEGKLSREKILEVKDFINKALGKGLGKYEKYYFKNDCHEIYAKLKDSCISSVDYERIADLIKKD